MPIFSYVVLPRSGKKKQLLQELNALEYCNATPADNEDVLILVTDSPDSDSEKNLQRDLKNLHSLESLHMSFGCNDDLQKEEGECYDA